MNLNWIISLVAVLVSMVTVIVSYFMNKDTLNHASKDLIVDKTVSLNTEIWKDCINTCNNIILKTSGENFEKYLNIILLNKNANKFDESVLNKINEEIASIHSLSFYICANVSAIDTKFEQQKIQIINFTYKAIEVFKNLQEF